MNLTQWVSAAPKVLRYLADKHHQGKPAATKWVLGAYTVTLDYCPPHPQGDASLVVTVRHSTTQDFIV